MSDDWTPNFGSISGSAPAWAAKKPVRIAVLGDFSGGALAGRLETGDDLARRKLPPVEFDNLEDTMARLGVTLSLPIGSDGAGVELSFGDLDAFHPDQLYREVPVFAALADLRKRLNNTSTFAKAAAEVQAMTGGVRVSRSAKRRSRGGTPDVGAKLSDFARLVGHAAEVETDAPVDRLLRNIVGPFVVTAPDPKKDQLVASVDAALSDAMRAILHHGDFQNLEAAWRGVDMLLRRLETGPMLQVLLLDVSAEEFAADLSGVDDLRDSGLYSLLVDKPSQEKNGGLSLVCGLYHFEPSPPHVELLGRMAQVAAHAGAPFVTSMAGDAFMDRRNPPHPLIEEAMSALRGLPASANLMLMAPRFLLRHPYGKRSDPVSAFDFEEFSLRDGLRSMLWGHPALLAAALLAAPGGRQMAIDDLPFHYMVDGDGDQVALPCTERLVNTEAAGRLANAGIVALMAHKGQPELRLSSFDSVGGAPLVFAGVASRPSAFGRHGASTSLGTKIEKPAAGAAPAAPQPAAGGKAPAAASAAAADAAEAGGDADLDALLASLGGDDAVAAPAADDAGGSGDAELDALLASLGGDDAAPADDGGEPAADEEAMDPELAALLASLE